MSVGQPPAVGEREPSTLPPAADRTTSVVDFEVWMVMSIASIVRRRVLPPPSSTWMAMSRGELHDVGLQTEAQQRSGGFEPESPRR